MYDTGIVKPVYMIIAMIKTAVGTRASIRDLETEPIVLKSILITKVIVKEIRKKKKKAPGSRLRFVRKYRTRLNAIALKIFVGMSVKIEANASAEGWYRA